MDILLIHRYYKVSKVNTSIGWFNLLTLPLYNVTNTSIVILCFLWGYMNKLLAQSVLLVVIISYSKILKFKIIHCGKHKMKLKYQVD